ncbi:epoxide hydrolase [Mucidula mucida]|nr:epoxide hydrolase [Mucidula mucida]
MSMDPKNPNSFCLREISLTTGRDYQFVDEVPDNYSDTAYTPTLLCLHGFPDLWYGWRHQIGPWVRSGYRVVVPTMLGYGETDKPSSPAEYTMKKLCADLVALLDFLNIEKPVVIGHDWGAYTAARFALWHPSRLNALVIMSVPYIPPSREHVSIHEIAKRVPKLRYQAYFSDPNFTPQVEEMLAPFLKMVWSVPGTNPGLNKVPLLLTPEEFSYYHNELKKGMNGPLNYYRTDKLRHDEEKAAGLPSHLRDDLPVLFLWGTKDPTTVASSIAKAHKFIPRLQDIALEGKGHWIQVEAKEEVTRQVLTWLDTLSLRQSVYSKAKM